MFERLQNLDLAQSGDGHSLLFVVHQDTFERDGFVTLSLNGLVDLSTMTVSCILKLYRNNHIPKSTFAKFCQKGVIALLTASLEHSTICILLLLATAVDRLPFCLSNRS